MTEDSTIGGSLGERLPGLKTTVPVGFPHRVGPYELIEELGRGGMGVVYKAHRDDSGEEMAIKLLSGRGIDDPKLRQRFVREARAASSISHPNIARVQGIFEDGPVLAIVMDYLPGETLRAWIKRRQGNLGPECDVGWIIRIAKQISRGLAAAHRAGVIHRDIKPSNVLLDPTGEHAWVADFGLAIFELADDSLTSTGQQLGTPAYMSPEQAKGERVDRRSDLFSLGCMIYAMVTGESPFHATNLMAVMRKISDYTPPSLSDRDHRVSPALARVVGRLLEKDPADRYDRAEDVIAALESCERNSATWPLPPAPNELTSTRPIRPDEGGDTEPGGAGAPEKSGRLEETSVAEPSSALETTEAVPDDLAETVLIRRKGPRRATALGLAVLAGLFATGWVVLRPRPQPAPVHRRETTPPPAQAGPMPVAPPTATEKAGSPRAGRHLTVSTGPSADYASLTEALAAAQPYDTIEVLDGADYDGPFLIDDPYRFEGVHLISKHGATLRASQDHGRLAIVNIDGVRRVRIEGFRVAGGTHIHSISLRGNVAGTTLSGLQLVQPADAQWANVMLSRECRGTADENVLISSCRFESGKYGIFSGRIDVADAMELSHVLIDGNHFSGTGSHVFLLHSASEIRVEHNLFEGGHGIEFSLGSSRHSGPFQICNNTFFGTEGWVSFGSDRADYGGFAANNLIVDTGSHPWEDAFGPRRGDWNVHHNIRESRMETGNRALDGFGRSMSDAGLISRDPASPDFARPTAGGIAATGGAGDSLPGYVGARRPLP